MTRFADVPEDHKFYDDIEWMAETSITKGAGNNDAGQPIFDPTGIVSRQHMAAFLHRFYTMLGSGPMGPRGPQGFTGATGPQGTVGTYGKDGKVEVFIDGIPFQV